MTRRIGPCLGLFSCLLVASVSASAQSSDAVSLLLLNDADGIVRQPPTASGLLLNQFNRQDCLDDELITFALILSGSTAQLVTFHAEAWVGIECEDASNRESGACVKVASARLASHQIVVPLRNLVLAPGSSVNAADPCASSSATPTRATVSFMLLDDNDRPPPNPADLWFVPWSFSYDFSAPSAPVSVAASSLAGGLRVSWEHPDAPADMRQYVLLCDPPRGAAATDANDAGGASSVCDATALRSGEVPTADELATYACGAAYAGLLSGDATALSGDSDYAVGVVARDDYGNLSPLSETVCGVPSVATRAEPVTDVELSRGCALSRAQSDSSGSAWLLGALGALARFARRRARPL
jgi:hypothetical protein